MDGKVSFAALQDAYDFSAAVFAKKAEVSTDIVYYMRKRIPVARQEAEKVLCKLTELTGTPYTLQNVEVILIEENITEGTREKGTW